jgi:ubiquitin carboxyl-terminal hydrolase 5/13
MFKALVGKGHEEFATMRQQDSEEFLQHLLKTLRQDNRKQLGAGNEGGQAASTFEFGTEQKLKCHQCGGVSYKVDHADSLSLPVPAKEKGIRPAEDGTTPVKEYEPITLQQCLEISFSPESLQYNCPSCKQGVTAEKWVAPAGVFAEDTSDLTLCNIQRNKTQNLPGRPRFAHAKVSTCQLDAN